MLKEIDVKYERNKEITQEWTNEVECKYELCGFISYNFVHTKNLKRDHIHLLDISDSKVEKWNSNKIE